MRFIAIIAVSMCVASTVHSQEGSPLVSFKHVEHLTETIRLEGEEVNIVHVYANYPDYEWVGAADSGEEGVACVDDAARAAVVYLRHFELHHDKHSLARAKSLLKFVLHMQADNGEFYNFVYADHTINTQGRTSYKSFGWWASRAFWALGHGYRVFRSVDAQFAARLKFALDLALPHVEKLMGAYGNWDSTSGYRTPRWLPYESGADVSSELLLGLVELYRADPDTVKRNLIEKISEGVIGMQDGDAVTFPFGLHRSWRTVWHAWGNSQTQALAYAGKALAQPAFIASAEREAVGFYSRLLISGFLKEMDLAAPQKKVEFEQIAYCIRPMALGLLRLYEATSKDEYLTMAALSASWFFGNNVAGVPMYDSSTGRCYDGIRDSSSVNRNSGAESTIEALYVLTELERYPQTRKYLRYRKTQWGTTPEYLYAMFNDGSGNQLTLAIDLTSKKLLLLEGNESEEFQGKLR